MKRALARSLLTALVLLVAVAPVAAGWTAGAPAAGGDESAHALRATPASASASPSWTAWTPASATDVGTAGSTGLTVPGAAATAPSLTQTVAFSRDPEPGRVTAVVSYDVPKSVEELTVTVPSLASSSVSFASESGFQRRNETTFEWDGGTRTPSLTLHVAVGNATYGVGDRGVEGDGWAFAIEPGTSVSWRYYGPKPVYSERLTVDGDGYTRDHLAYMGPYDSKTVRVADERATFVVSAVTGRTAADTSRLSSFLTVANEHFDFGVHREETTVFVLPLDVTRVNHLEGATVGTSMWVTADSLSLDSQSDAFPHEYVHTRLGVVGQGSAEWLTEATATYYGHAFALNYGVGSFEDFRRAMTAERFAADRRGVVLTDPASWEGTLANYQKGAQVLAALDAEMRRRTDGEHTLADVFERKSSFESYRAFRSTVVEVSGDGSLGDWLDRYASTTALPPVPDDPSLYVYGGTLDPDGDGLRSDAERTAGTNPFAADTDGDGLEDGSDPNPLTPRTMTATTTATATPTRTSSPGAVTTRPVDSTTSAGAQPSTTTADGRGFGAALALAGVAVAIAAARSRRREN